jgi:predicted GNAT family N-acyltransferase
MKHAETIDHPARNRNAEIRIARSFDDLLMVYSIRSAVYIAEQECPFAEEFDGNDHCATHLVGFIKGEPAGCIRVRFFYDFAKIERLAVLKRFRKSALASDLVWSGIDLVRRKGFRRIYGTAREGLEGFWARFGGVAISDKKITVSGFKYTEMMVDLDPHPNAITVDRGPYVILRPEGNWDQPGILEISAARPVRDPGENAVQSMHVVT